MQIEGQKKKGGEAEMYERKDERSETSRTQREYEGGYYCIDTKYVEFHSVPS